MTRRRRQKSIWRLQHVEYQTYDAGKPNTKSRGKEEAVQSSSLLVVDATGSYQTGRVGVLADERMSPRRLGGTCRRDTCLGRNNTSTYTMKKGSPDGGPGGTTIVPDEPGSCGGGVLAYYHRLRDGPESPLWLTAPKP